MHLRGDQLGLALALDPWLHGLPRRLAAASPATTRSRVSARSYWVRAPKIENSSSPCGVVISICSISDLKAMPLPFSSVTMAKRRGRERPEAVDLPNRQAVAFVEVIEACF
jgi:hypothetical protein